MDKLDTNCICNIVIYGGSFDPVHNGHVQVIKVLQKEFDKVVVVPCLLSPHKDTVLDSQHRYNMLQLAIEGLENVYIDRQELDREPPSYAIDTVVNIRHQYPSANLYLCVGADNISSISSWHRYADIVELCTIVVFRRGQYSDLLFNRVEIVSNTSIPFETIKEHILPISSTVVRVANAVGWARYFVPHAVDDYIQQHNLYSQFEHISSRLYDYNLSRERLAHIRRSVVNGAQLASIYPVDLDKIVVAMLLHDIAKDCDIGMLQDMGIDTSGVEELPYEIRHSLAGRMIAQQHFGIQDSEILDAIEYHTTSRPGMSNFEKIVYLADFTEPGRLIGADCKIRQQLLEIISQACSGDLDTSMRNALMCSIESIKTKNMNVYPRSQQALNYIERILTAESGRKD